MRNIKYGAILKLSFFLVLVFSHLAFGKDPKALVEKMVQSVGGRDRLYALKDVEYEYTHHDVAEGKKDVSTERYIFDEELSWAKYSVREKFVNPDLEGEIIQAYDGKETWTTHDGKLLNDPQVLKFADFTRKTNFYWFTMMFKLLDPGVNYEYKGIRNVDGTEYEIVEITFGENVGDAQDTYVLYINPQTYLVDQFLYTVMDFGMKDPFLMKVQYEEIEGLKLPTKRVYAPADWQGIPKTDVWNEEISTNVKFDNGFERSMFEKPFN